MQTTADERVARRAARQLGLLKKKDALALGLSAKQIHWRVRTGRWERIGEGVYRIRGVPSSKEQDLLAACYLSRSNPVAHGVSVLGLFSAIAHPAKPHVLVPPTASGRHPLAIVHRGVLPAAGRTKVGPVPSTSPGRGLVDAVPLLDDDQLSNMLAVLCTPRGENGPITSPRSVAGALARASTGRPPAGTHRLLPVLTPWLEGLVPDSPGEARLLRRLAEWGFPTPVTQHRVRDGGGKLIARIDVAWPTFLAGLEYDAPLYHPPDRIAADDARKARLENLGWWIGNADVEDLRPSSNRLRVELRSHLRASAG